MATRSLAGASEAAQQIADSAATDNTVMLAQVGALIAHEVNNLLSPALARCDLLRTDLANGTANSKLIDAIQSSVAQASTISKTILEVAGNGNKRARTLVSPCVQNVVDTLLPPSVRSRIEVGALDARLCVAISKEELTHIVLNVVLNALQATTNTRRPITISCESTRQLQRSTRNSNRELAAIVISDQGVGTDTAVLLCCYRTLSWEQGRFVGKNLGTLLCRLLVERAGGEIEVHSERGRGTTVTVWLPTADYSSSGTSTTSPASTDSETELPA